MFSVLYLLSVLRVGQGAVLLREWSVTHHEDTSSPRSWTGIQDGWRRRKSESLVGFTETTEVVQSRWFHNDDMCSSGSSYLLSLNIVPQAWSCPLLSSQKCCVHDLAMASECRGLIHMDATSPTYPHCLFPISTPPPRSSPITIAVHRCRSRASTLTADASLNSREQKELSSCWGERWLTAKICNCPSAHLRVPFHLDVLQCYFEQLCAGRVFLCSAAFQGRISAAHIRADSDLLHGVTSCRIGT